MGRIVIIAFFLLGGTAISFGCGARTEQNEAVSRPARIAGLTAAAGETKPVPQIAGGPATDLAPTNKSESAATRPDEEPKHPRAIVLPMDERFLALGLPPADPGRYRKWSQLGLVRVGQTHLIHAALTGGGDQLLIAMSTSETTVRVYDRQTRKLIGNHRIPGFGQFDRGDVVAWPDPTGQPLFVFGKTDGLWLFDANSGAVVAHLDEDPVWQLRWSPDGRILVAGVSDIDTQTSRLTFFLRGAGCQLTGIGTIAFDERVDAWSLTRDNRYLAAIHYPSDTMTLIDLHTGQALWSVTTPEFAGDVAISPNGSTVAVGGAELLLCDAADPSLRTTFSKFGNNIGRVRFSPSGDAVITSSYDGRVRVFEFDLAKSWIRLIKELKHAGHSNVYELLFHDGGVGLISTSGDRTIRFWGR